MTCVHCELSVREEVGEVDGVQNVEVSATTGTLIVNARWSDRRRADLDAVNEIGYSAVRIS